MSERSIVLFAFSMHLMNNHSIAMQMPMTSRQMLVLICVTSKVV